MTNERMRKSENKRFTRRDFIKVGAGLGAAGLLTAAGTRHFKTFSSNATGKIVIIGGGAAGLSMAARLTQGLKKPDVTLIDPSDRQFYQPGFTLVASGVYKPDEVWKSQEKCIPKGIKWIKDNVIAVDPERNSVTTQSNGSLSYDFLVLTPGLQINWNLVEGISYDTLGVGNAHCIYDFKGAQLTWQAIQEFATTGGKGIFTDTYTKHKCGGAPKKICLLTEHFSRKQKSRDKLKLDFYTAANQLYDVPYYTPRLLEIYEQRNIPIHLETRIKGIDTSAKEVYLEKTEGQGDNKIKTSLIEEYDFLHFTPPMSAPDFVKEAGLSWTEGSLAAEGWVMTDKESLIHMKYPNIISLGDCAGIPTSKTSAAVREQVPVAFKNLISLMEGKEPVEKYNGYAACPIITDYGHVLLCEFDYDKKPVPTFPFSMMNTSHELRLAWLLKVYILKPLYFQGMLNGIA